MCDLREINGVIGEGVKFQRIRRITGYLVGDTTRFNQAKEAEVRDRIPHTLNNGLERI